MTRTTVVFFKDEDGSVPVLDWLAQVARRDRRIAAKCRAWINRLRTEGRALRRPTAEFLGDGIYELRIRFGSVNYRMLYFFIGEALAVISHGLVKEGQVPEKEMELARRRKALYESDPQRYSHEYKEKD